MINKKDNLYLEVLIAYFYNANFIMYIYIKFYNFTVIPY